MLLLAGAAPVPAADVQAGDDLTLALRHDTRTLARLEPAGEKGFVVVPSNRAAERRGDGYPHIDDLHLRVRTGTEPWRDLSSATARRKRDGVDPA